MKWAIKDLDIQFGYFRMASKDLDIQFRFLKWAIPDLDIQFGYFRIAIIDLDIQFIFIYIGLGHGQSAALVSSHPTGIQKSYDYRSILRLYRHPRTIQTS